MSVYDSAIRSKIAYQNLEDVLKIIPTAEFISNEEYDTQVYFWRIGEIVYVTFRGTSSFKDVLTDLNISTYRIRDKIRVHEGFYMQFKSVEIEITKRLVHNFDATRIIFAGHSLGGALAQIAAAYYGEIFDYSFVACHTFGSPRVGNKYFVEWFSKHVDENVRIANKKDPVPMIPTMYYWVHTTNDTPWYKRLYKVLFKSNLSEHSCDLYIQNISVENNNAKVRDCSSPVPGEL